VPKSSPLLLPMPLGCSEHRRPSPLNEFGRHAVVSPVSGEGRRPARVPPFSAQLAPHLTLPLTDLQGRRRITLALVSRPLPSEHCRAGLSPPPHRRPTSSVSRAVVPLAQRTPPTALMPLPSTPQQGSHWQAMATRAGFGRGDRASSRPRARRTHAPWATATVGPGRPMGHHAVAPSRHSGPPANAMPRHCGLGLEPRPSAGFHFFLFFSIQ
jgi:hypothetical protein